jgi:hypothetical protein
MRCVLCWHLGSDHFMKAADFCCVLQFECWQSCVQHNTQPASLYESYPG